MMEVVFVVACSASIGMSIWLAGYWAGAYLRKPSAPARIELRPCESVTFTHLGDKIRVRARFLKSDSECIRCTSTVPEWKRSIEVAEFCLSKIRYEVDRYEVPSE